MGDYLLDVNVLVAHAVLEHVHHELVVSGLDKITSAGGQLHVCPIVELGLMRNTMRIASITIDDAKRLLENERVNLGLKFVPDDLGAVDCSDWVQGYRQTTDAYLSALAAAHGLVLLTVDKAIPRARCLLV